MGGLGSVIQQLQRGDFITLQVFLTTEINKCQTERSGLPLSYRSVELAVSSCYVFVHQNTAANCCYCLFVYMFFKRPDKVRLSFPTF